MLTEKQSATAAWLLGGLIFGLLVIRNAGLASPLLAGDEYAYFAQAKVFPASTVLYARDPWVQRVFNPLFAALGHGFMETTHYAERALVSFNVLLFALCVLAAVFLAKQLSTSPGSLLLPAAVAALSPLSAHTAYFMPEMLYFALAFGVLLTLVMGMQRAPFASVAIAGCLVGALALVKSHALSVAGAGVLSTLLISWLLQRTSFVRAGALLAVFLVSAATSVFLLYLVLTHEVLSSPRTLLGLYSGYVEKSAEASTWITSLPAMLGNLGGHAVVALSLAAPPLATLTIIALRALRRSPESELSTIDATRARFAFVALAMLGGALAMTVVFTVAAERSGQEHQVLRLHGRYYSYTLLPIIVAYFCLQNILTAKDTRIVAGVGLLATLAMLVVRAHFQLYPWDYPEAFVFTAFPVFPMRWAAHAVIAVGTLSYGAQIWRPGLARVAYPIFIVFAYVLANIAMSRWQYDHSATSGSYSDAGRALKAVLGDAELERAVVVAPEHFGNAPLAHFLFGLAANPHVVMKPVGDRIDANDFPTDVAHVVTLGRYSVTLPQRASLGVADWTLFEVGGSGPRIRQAVELWDGRTVDLLPGTAHDTSALDGFNESEPWGAWTAVDPAVVALPVIVSGPLRLMIDGWVVPEDVATDVDVQIGTGHASIRFSDTREVHCVNLDVSPQSHEIILRGAKPRRPDEYHRALGLAVVRIMVARLDDQNLADACAAVPTR